MRVTIIKKLFEDLIAASVTVVLILLLFVPGGTAAAGSAPGPVAYTEPAGGVGRVVTCTIEKKMHDDLSAGASPRPTEKTEETAAVYVCGEFAPEEETVFGTSSTADAVPLPRTAGKAQEEIDRMIREAAERYGLPWELVSAVCWAESRYNPDAVSSTPDYGLMQVTASVCAAYGLDKDNRLDPEANLDAGCRILREKIDESGGDLTSALIRYNEGDVGLLSRHAAGGFATEYTDAVLGKYYELLVNSLGDPE